MCVRFVCDCGLEDALAHLWRSEETFPEFSPSISVSGDQTQVTRPDCTDCKGFYLMSHLIGPVYFYFLQFYFEIILDFKECCTINLISINPDFSDVSTLTHLMEIFYHLKVSCRYYSVPTILNLGELLKSRYLLL